MSSESNTGTVVQATGTTSGTDAVTTASYRTLSDLLRRLGTVQTLRIMGSVLADRWHDSPEGAERDAIYRSARAVEGAADAIAGRDA